MKNLRELSQDDIDQNKRMYDKYFEEYRMEDGWFPGNQEANFYRMLKIADFTGFPISGSSCLDVGCGTGDFSEVLRKRGASKYLGIDIYNPSLAKAREKYPQEKFVYADILKGEIKEKFDYVFCSGAFTVKLVKIDNYDFLESMLVKMWQLAKVGMVFNFLSDHEPVPNKELFFYNTDKVFSICREIAPDSHIIVQDDHEEYQFHFYVYR